VAATVQYIIKTSEKGAILVFMPGIQEIKSSIDALNALPLGSTIILPLHSNLSSEEQKRVFNNTKSRKIVVATNIAEVRLKPRLIPVLNEMLPRQVSLLTM
jgi:ATP-dependent RNA helicase DHX57